MLRSTSYSRVALMSLERRLAELDYWYTVNDAQELPIRSDGMPSQYTYASVFQMLRGSIIVFSGILSVLFLKR